MDAGRLHTRVVAQGPYAALDVVTVTGSTNADLIEAAKQGAPDHTVLLAEEQEAGRGRLQRNWVSPRGYGLHMSILLRPDVPQSAVAWLPLISGVALAEAVRELGVEVALKWPNDLLIKAGSGWGKAAGVLAEGLVTEDGVAVVLGMGVNVHHGAEQLPAGGGLAPTSLELCGADVDRERFAAELLLAFAEVDALWREQSGDAVGSGLFDRYQRLCGTLGKQVRVELGEQDLHGTASEIDPSGRLVVHGADGAVTPVSAGDVVHLRPA